MQRLFSTFPNHLPGAGLLLMRLTLGATLVYLGAADLQARTAAAYLAQSITAIAAGLLMIAGLWTPLAASIAAVEQVWAALDRPFSQQGCEWIHVLLGALCTSTAMLGPGAWSIDARLFGRRRFPSHRTLPKDHPTKG